VSDGSTAVTDLLLFTDPRDRARSVALVERCDHLIAGWWSHVPRYARLGAPPTAVILCRDHDSATGFARLADEILVACHARIGTPPEAWAYPGREGVVIAVERDLHEGRLVGYRVPPVGAAVRRERTGTLRCEPIAGLVVEPTGGDRPTWR
jgi:hypothetical protein